MAQLAMLQRLTELLLPELGDCAMLVVLDEEERVVERAAAHVDGRRRDAALALADRLPDAGGPLLRALGGGPPVLVADLAADDRCLELVPCAEAAGVHAAACVSLGHEVAGGFAIFSAQRGVYERSHLPLLAAVGRCAERVLRPSSDPLSEAESLLAGVHHDLGNPLQAARLNLEVVSGIVGPGKARVPLDNARRSVEQIAALLDELKDYLQPRDSHADGSDRCTAAAAVSQVLEVMAPLAEAKRTRLVGSVADGGSVVTVGSNQLFRVLSNLVGNAIKYTQSGGSVQVSTARTAVGLSFRVQDNGPGLDVESRARVLDPGWVAGSSIRRGSGLGLAIARRIVEAHGGRIQVASTPGAGCTFIVTLPVVR